MQATVAEGRNCGVDRIGVLCLDERIDVPGRADDLVRRQGQSADQRELHFDRSQGACDFCNLPAEAGDSMAAANALRGLFPFEKAPQLLRPRRVP